MAYQAIFRRWRPQTFEELIGQPLVVRTLKNALKSDRVSHAYLFSGPRGVGKTTVARILAKALNCKNGPSENPCNRCTSCKEISQGISPDVQEIDGASNRGIGEIRNLKANVKFLPTTGNYRIFIIDEVHMLTPEAFNALLKTLEEPPRHVKFIFATTEPHKVPVTIMSRCQRFEFRRIPASELTSALKATAEKEGIKIEDAALELIARRSEGSMRDAQGLLDQLVAACGEDISYADVAEIVGEIQSSLIADAARAIVNRETASVFGVVSSVYERGYDLKEFYKCIMELFKNALLAGSGADPKDMGLPPWQEGVIRDINTLVGPETLGMLLGLMLKYHELLRMTDEPRIVLETLLLRLSSMTELVPLQRLYELLVYRGQPQGYEGARIEETIPISTAQPAHPPHYKAEVARDWEGFLGFLKEKKGLMAKSLSGWEVVTFDPSEIVLKRPDHPVLCEYLDDNGRMNEFKKYWKEYFGSDVTVSIVERKQGDTDKGSNLDQLIKAFKAERLPNGSIFSGEKGEVET